MRASPAKYSLVGVFVAFAMVGCDKVKQAVRCDNICKKYEDCIASDLRVNRCSEDCRDAAEDSKTFARAVEDCADCIERRACAEVTEDCAVCADVVQSFDEGGSF